MLLALFSAHLDLLPLIHFYACICGFLMTLHRLPTRLRPWQGSGERREERRRRLAKVNFEKAWCSSRALTFDEARGFPGHRLETAASVGREQRACGLRLQLRERPSCATFASRPCFLKSRSWLRSSLLFAAYPGAHKSASQIR